MKYRKFANTNIELSSIGLGCMGMSAAYGQKDDIQSLATLETNQLSVAALAKGIYLVTIEGMSGRLWQTKLIKE